MKKILYSIAVIPLMGVMVLGATPAYAFGGNGNGRGEGMHRGGQGFELVPQEMREAFRGEFQELSNEEKEAIREERREMREVHREEMEAFMGVNHEEMRELHRSGESVGTVLIERGVTEDDAEEFLTEKANDRIDDIVERHNLDSDEEETLRSRVTAFVERMLERWF